MNTLTPLLSAMMMAAIAVLPASGIRAADIALPQVPAPESGLPGIQHVSVPPPDLIPDVDPMTLYGGDVLFDVYRKGKKVGEHRMNFSRDAIGDIAVKAQFHLAIDVLFFTAYTFDYGAVEIWRGKEVVALGATADDNGKVTKTSAQLEDGVFKITGPAGVTVASSWVFPTNHWNRGQVESSVILNTLTGKLAHVKIENRGVEKVETASGAVDAEHFAYTGDLRDTHTWYDSSGRWVKMRFKANDGSEIDYVCRRCGLGAPDQP